MEGISRQVQSMDTDQITEVDEPMDTEVDINNEPMDTESSMPTRHYDEITDDEFYVNVRAGKKNVEREENTIGITHCMHTALRIPKDEHWECALTSLTFPQAWRYVTGDLSFTVRLVNDIRINPTSDENPAMTYVLPNGNYPSAAHLVNAINALLTFQKLGDCVVDASQMCQFVFNEATHMITCQFAEGHCVKQVQHLQGVQLFLSEDLQRLLGFPAPSESGEYSVTWQTDVNVGEYYLISPITSLRSTVTPAILGNYQSPTIYVHMDNIETTHCPPGEKRQILRSVPTHSITDHFQTHFTAERREYHTLRSGETYRSLLLVLFMPELVEESYPTEDIILQLHFRKNTSRVHNG